MNAYPVHLTCDCVRLVSRPYPHDSANWYCTDHGWVRRESAEAP